MRKGSGYMNKAHAPGPFLAAEGSLPGELTGAIGCGLPPVGTRPPRPALTRSQAGVWSMPIAAARRQPCPSGQEHAEDGGRAVGTRGPAT